MITLNFKFQGNNESPTKLVGNSRSFNITIDEPEALRGTYVAANPVE